MFGVGAGAIEGADEAAVSCWITGGPMTAFEPQCCQYRCPVLVINKQNEPKSAVSLQEPHK